MPLVRLFIAAPLSETIHRNISAILDELNSKLGHRSIKWVRPSGVHLTLKFLGETPSSRIPTLQEKLEEVSQGYAPLPISIQGIGCFPHCRRPRVIWIGVKDRSGGLVALQEEIELGMQELGFPRERRAFHPHLTLGRVKRRAKKSEIRRIGELVSQIDPPIMGRQSVDRLSLMKSDLQPTGAVYASLFTSVLRGES